VVAAEVRNLASVLLLLRRRSKTLIGDSVDKVEKRLETGGTGRHTMEEIVTSIKRVTDIMSEISAASTEQSAASSR